MSNDEGAKEAHIPEGEPEYVPLAIRDKRTSVDGSIEYLIEWEVKRILHVDITWPSTTAYRRKGMYTTR